MTSFSRVHVVPIPAPPPPLHRLSAKKKRGGEGEGRLPAGRVVASSVPEARRRTRPEVKMKFPKKTAAAVQCIPCYARRRRRRRGGLWNLHIGPSQNSQYQYHCQAPVDRSPVGIRNGTR